MTTDIRNDVARYIQVIDGDNSVSPADLGESLAVCIAPTKVHELVHFVERANPDKTMDAGALTDAIVDEFNLDEGN